MQFVDYSKNKERKSFMGEYQSTLGDFGVPMYDSGGSGSMYNDNSYYTGGYQTTLNQFDNNLSSPGLYPSSCNYGQFSTGGSLHDTFKVDRYDNIYGGHTTLDLGNNQKVHMPWNY